MTVNFSVEQMSILSEYRQSLKMADAEETLDLVLYRPLAFGIVKAIYRLPVTPNQLTSLSFICGCVSAYFFSLGDASALTAAATWLFAANVFDCCDGQLARMQQSGTPLGRIIDGMADYLVSIALFAALGIALVARTGDATYWYLIVGVAITSALHAFMFDYRQQNFMGEARGATSFSEREIARVGPILAEKREHGRNPLMQLVLKYYLAYMGMQHRVELGNAGPSPTLSSGQQRAHKFLMLWWSLLGSTTNRSLLIIAAFIGDPLIYLWSIIAIGNMWLLIGLFLQNRFDVSLNSEHPLTATRDSQCAFGHKFNHS